MATRADVAKWNAVLEGARASEIAQWAATKFGEELVIACSFSLENACVIDLMSRHLKPPKVFSIDTGRLPEETYQNAEELASRYGLDIQWYFPEAPAVQGLLRQKGSYSFRESLENRKECCGIRKVEPLNRALQGRAAWMTGRRRAQGVTRGGLQAVELDEAHGGIVKVNPLIDWSTAQVEAYVADRDLPIHPLYFKGYPSIGCAPCTRAIKTGESERDGRWWWEEPDHKECGLHNARPAATAAPSPAPTMAEAAGD